MRIIAGEARSRVIEAPKGRDTRPTLDRVRENMFNILQRRVPGARVLDLFAGSGALSLEALSRGAAFAVLVDHDRQAVQVEQRNLAALRFAERARVMQREWRQAVDALARENERFDLVFLDPPYAMTDLTDVTASLAPLLASNALVMVEHEATITPRLAPDYVRTDARKYGFVGVSFYTRDGGGTADGADLRLSGQL